MLGTRMGAGGLRGSGRRWEWGSARSELGPAGWMGVHACGSWELVDWMGGTHLNRARPDTEAPTQRAGADTESDGARHRERRPRHRERWVPTQTRGPTHMHKEVGLHVFRLATAVAMALLFRWRRRVDDPESVRQWLLQSWVSVCFSQRLFLKARMHH